MQGGFNQRRRLNRVTVTSNHWKLPVIKMGTVYLHKMPNILGYKSKCHTALA